MSVSTYTTKPDNQNNRAILEPYEVILFAIAAIGIFFDQYWVIFLCLIVIIFFRDVFRMKEFQRKGAGRALTGKLVFENDKIIIGSQQFDLKVLNKLKIQIWDYDGERDALPGNSKQIKKGIHNTLAFEINGNRYSFTFYLESELMKAELGNLLAEWYKSGVIFQEFDKNGRTYGLKQLNYKQIQEFKQSVRE